MPKELTLRDHASDQLKRLAHIRGFPQERAAIADYLNALAVMESFEGVTRLMNELVETEWISFPQASVIRRMAWERSEETRKKRKACELCGGSGFQSIAVLVTYHGNSLSPKRFQHIPDDYEARLSFDSKLAEWQAKNPTADRQMTVTAAKDCECRKVPA